MGGAAAAAGASQAVTAAAAKPNAIDDLLGLETELSAIQAGIQQIDKIAPTPPMSFQTESMMPLSLVTPPQSQVPVVSHQSQAPAQPRRPVAVMNQNPPVSEFSTAPFLPPPPSKPGRKQEQPGQQQQQQQQAAGQGQDRYAVFDSVQAYAHNNNILQQQQQQPPAAAQQPGFGGSFMDDGK